MSAPIRHVLDIGGNNVRSFAYTYTYTYRVEFAIVAVALTGVSEDGTRRLWNLPPRDRI